MATGKLAELTPNEGYRLTPPPPQMSAPPIAAKPSATICDLPYCTNAISLGRHSLVKKDLSGLYRRKMVNHPLPGVV